MKTEAITITESKRFIELEVRIRNGWIDAGKALIEIRDSQLYRADYATFEDYCAEVWGYKKRNVFYLMESVKLLDSLPKAKVQNFAPSASTVRAIAAVPEEHREEVLESVAADGPVTAKAIKAKVAARKPKVIEVEPEPERPAVVAPLAGIPATVLWMNAELSLPDSDLTVLIHCPKSDDPIWLGYHDGEEWCLASGDTIWSGVSHWAQLPEAPAN